jgi:hypothetical protein
MGALTCIHELAESHPHLLDLDSVSLYGVSGGAFVALLCAMKIQPIEIHDLYLSKFSDYQVMSIRSGVDAITNIMNDLIEQYDLDLTLLSNRLHIGVSVPSGFQWITEFTSNQHLITTIINSSTIPLAIPRTEINKQQIDGGMSIDISDIPIHNTLHILKPYALKPLIFGVIPIPLIPTTKFISRLYFEFGIIEARNRIRDYLKFGNDDMVWKPITEGVRMLMWHLHGL